MIIGAAMMLMAVAVGAYIFMGLVGWTVLKFIFGWGQRHCNWTKYTNFNGILFIIIIATIWILLSYAIGGIGYPEFIGPNKVPPLSHWDRLLRGMGFTALAVIELGLIALGIFIVVIIIRATLGWLFKQGR